MDFARGSPESRSFPELRESLLDYVPIPRRNTWDAASFRNWQKHIEDSLLYDAIPPTIGAAALLRDGRHRGRECTTAVMSCGNLCSATSAATVGNLVNTCMGSGMLSLPWVLARCGIGGGEWMLHRPLLMPLPCPCPVLQAALLMV